MNSADSKQHEYIKKVAHELWQSEGRPEGKSEQHWQQARILVEGPDKELDDALKTDRQALHNQSSSEPEQPDQT